VKKIKIISLSYNDIDGGASFVAYRIFNYLNEKKIDSKLFVIKKDTKNSKVYKFQNKKKNNFLKKIFFFFLKEKNKYSFYNYGNYLIKETSQLDKLIKEKPSAIIVYNNSNFIKPELINFLYSKKIKIIFSLTDQELITGGCHYNFNCKKFKTNCYPCPATRFPLYKIASKNLSQKFNSYFPIKISFLCASKKVVKDVSNSVIFNRSKHKVYLNYYSLDLKKYKPLQNYNKKSKIVIGFRSSLNPRKGNKYIIDALNHLIFKDRNIINKIKFNIIGDSSIIEYIKKKGFDYSFKTNVDNENKLIKFYNDLDFFINQSIQDQGPMMVNEALACGVPVISFEIGVAVDFIKKNYNGYLIKSLSSKLLAEKILYISKLKNKKIKNMKKNSRKTAYKFLDLNKNIKKIIKVCK